jgi:imidazolonepropionase-like amidohydrolase
MPSVLESYRDPKQLWSEWRQALERGRRIKEGALASVRLLAGAGVPLLAASDAGWIAGAFQGHSSHAAQSWLERAGVPAWTRLAAATIAAAAAFGRHDVGFEPGHAADFLALDADPVERAENLRRISLVLRGGEVVDRRGLLPDLTRNKFKP